MNVSKLPFGKFPSVVGLSGRIAAGKTAAARRLERMGFSYTRFSLVIDEVVVERGLPLDRPTRQMVGLEIHESLGQAWLCEKALNRVGGADLIVVDGLRWPEDHAFFVDRFGTGFCHIHVAAAAEFRYARRRNLETRDAFDRADAQPVEAMIDTMARFASHIVVNVNTLAQFEAEIIRIVGTANLEAR